LTLERELDDVGIKSEETRIVSERLAAGKKRIDKKKSRSFVNFRETRVGKKKSQSLVDFKWILFSLEILLLEARLIRSKKK